MAGTVIGEGITIEGDMSAEEEVLVLGTLRGALKSSDAVSVGSTGVVEADVSGATLSIAGRVTGDVSTTDRVDLQAGGKLVGDVRAVRFTIADGATFKGNVDMDL
jgi:cytoskeletal protein CcmA (bactofilin family)